ncbi:hypothetical protein BpHYR1_016111 [Brachionus plicatilis]|uniref:Uncharacterized protein n=1 Tax=Brachionus plicatilis TaxID=10195 RepID=A0A3M7QGQ8_BRAPC|nr:hypothetical protein BpHYR1_016111 [Brachionus plicatilis]
MSFIEEIPNNISVVSNHNAQYKIDRIITNSFSLKDSYFFLNLILTFCDILYIFNEKYFLFNFFCNEIIEQKIK